MEAVFIDTHVAMWLYFGEMGALSKPALELIESADLLVSSIVVLEIDFFHEVEKTAIKGQFIISKLEQTLAIEIPNDPWINVISEASLLKWTCDPFNRLIVAHGKLHRALLVTKDRLIHQHYTKAIG